MGVVHKEIIGAAVLMRAIQQQCVLNFREVPVRGSAVKKKVTMEIAEVSKTNHNSFVAIVLVFIVFT